LPRGADWLDHSLKGEWAGALLVHGIALRDGRKLTAPWDELQANVSLMAET